LPVQCGDGSFVTVHWDLAFGMATDDRRRTTADG
jgi:hypothetical protein